MVLMTVMFAWLAIRFASRVEGILDGFGRILSTAIKAIRKPAMAVVRATSVGDRNPHRCFANANNRVRRIRTRRRRSRRIG
jgi:hypothetical protein